MDAVNPEQTPPTLTHLRQDGSAQMVDVSAKAETTREATATATVRTTREVLGMLGSGGLPKGDALAVARVAGIMAAKKTPELIPLCHPLPLSKVTDLRSFGSIGSNQVSRRCAVGRAALPDCLAEKRSLDLRSCDTRMAWPGSANIMKSASQWPKLCR